MQVNILSENGYEEALFGLGLSHGVTSGMTFEDFMYYEPMEVHPVSLGITHEPVTSAEFEQMEHVSQKLAGKGNGHDKFLRQICVWIDVSAPRYWWPEMDQYKVATVTQSESTMHTIHKEEFSESDFEGNLYVDCGIGPSLRATLNYFRQKYIETKNKEAWKALIQLLPQSYLQRRILTCNYATLRNIIAQRTGHRLSEWAVFIDAIKAQAAHPELLP